MATLAGVLAVACLAVAAFHLLRLVLVRTDPIGEASHAAMGIGMAAMFSPLGDPVPAPVWTGVFAACGVWFAAVALRSGGLRRADAVHHVVGSGAMLFMLLGAHGAGIAGAGEVHAAHGHDAGDGLGVGSVAAIVLTGYFAWHVLRCGDRIGHAACADDAPDPGPGGLALRAPVAVVRDARTQPAAHAVMAAAMAVMLLGMI